MFVPLGTGREVSRLPPSENLGLLCEGEVKVHEGKTIPVFKIIRIGGWGGLEVGDGSANFSVYLQE